jgi:hypothetical protein
VRWNSEHGHDRRIIDIGGWHELAEVEARFPDCAGVYVFADADLDVKYVGKADAKRLRAEALAAVASCDRREGAALAGWLATKSGDGASAFATLLIAFYDPPNNAR